jgi:hypothetical protein
MGKPIGIYREDFRAERIYHLMKREECRLGKVGGSCRKLG